MTTLNKFTIVGADNEGKALFVHAFAANVDQLKHVVDALFQGCLTFVLGGHAQAIDGQQPQHLADLAATATVSAELGVILQSYLDWYDNPSAPLTPVKPLAWSERAKLSRQCVDSGYLGVTLQEQRISSGICYFITYLTFDKFVNDPPSPTLLGVLHFDGDVWQACSEDVATFMPNRLKVAGQFRVISEHPTAAQALCSLMALVPATQSS